MPILRFQDDGSIGSALGQLAAGINAANDPKAALQGEYIRQQIEASKANAAKTMLETQQLQGQIGAQDALGKAAMGAFDATYPRPQTMLAPDVQGPPMPQEMAQGLNTSYDANRGLYSASVNNAARRGGGPLDALRIGPMALAQSGVMMNGAPTDEGRARQMQTMLTGQLPDAKTPFTDTARQTMGNEELERQKALEGYKISKTPLDANKAWLIPNQDHTFTTVNADKIGGWSGDGSTTQAMNIMERFAVKANEGTATQKDLDDYDVAWTHVYGPKTETREINGVATPTTIQNPPPSNRPAPSALRAKFGLQPGLTGGPTSAPAPAPAADSPVPPAGQAPAAATGNLGVTVGTPLGANKPMGQEPTKLAGYVTQMMAGHQQLDEIVKQGKLPTVFERLAANPDTYGKPGENNVKRELGTTFLANDDANTHATAANQFLDGVLRNQSGAVIGTNEYEKVATYTIPKNGDTASQIATKKMNREVLINAYEKGVLGEDPKVIIANAKNIIEANMAQQRPQTGPAPGGKDPYADVKAITGYRR